MSSEEIYTTIFAVFFVSNVIAFVIGMRYGSKIAKAGYRDRIRRLFDMQYERYPW